MDKYKFGEFLYQKRKKIGLTQEELGRKLGVTNKAVSKWEVGETLPEVTMLEPLANLLGITVDELLTQRIKKEEEKKVKKISTTLIVISSVMLFITICTIICSIIYVNYQLNKEEKVILSQDNINEIINIDPMNNFICNDQEIIISTTACLNDKYYLKDQDNITLIIEYEINYYYYLENDKLGVVSYLKRSETVTLNKDNLNQEIKLTLNPVNEIPDFKYFKNVEVNYTIIEFDGIVYN